MQVAIVIVNYGTPQLVGRLLDSLRVHPDAALVAEAVLVDNGFPTRGDLRQAIRPQDYTFPVRFVQNADTSYASGANRGAAVTSQPLIAISNSDIEWPTGGGIRPLLNRMQRESQIGVGGPGLLYPDGSWQRSFGRFPSLLEQVRALLFLEILDGARTSWSHRRGRAERIRPVDYVDGAFMMIRRACFERLGGFDESFPFYGEDSDFCWRAARAGWRRVCVPTAQLIHLRGASSRALDSARYMQRFEAARREFVARHFGERNARWFMWLERVVSYELAAAYGILGAVRRTPAWRRRAHLARSRAQAAWNLQNRSSNPTP